jgi:spore coat polysaccharide biosynthesis protein SpsF (cytidylyltransferase family)
MTLLIIQARMGSLRLPGKVMKSINKKPLLYFMINQLKNCKIPVKLVVATSTKKKDDTIASYVQSLGVEVFRGNEDDVLDRFYKCALNFGDKTIVRICADSPLIDPNIVDKCITEFQQGPFDYFSNTIQNQNKKWVQHYNGFPLGFAVEVFTLDALTTAWTESKLSSDREHVTEYIFHNPDKFRLGSFSCHTDYSYLRLVVDYPEDLQLVKEIIRHFDEKHCYTLKELVDFFNKNPELIKINSKYNKIS